MNIKVFCFGKIDSKPINEILKDFLDRIKHYAHLEIIELDEFYSADVISNQLKNEAILNQKIKTQKNIWLLDIESKQIDSVKFSEIIENNKDYLNANMAFIIGPSDGFSSQFKTNFENKISFGKITLPHQLFRVILIEQIYRSFKIMKNEKYHK